jgi:C4-dicarboxylate transporter DctQ subunit
MFNRFLNRLEEWIIGSLMCAGTLVIFVAVVHRFLAGVPYIQDYAIKLDLTWAQELCIIMFVWMAKFGAAYGVRTGIHVGVDVLVRSLSPSKAKVLTFISLMAGAFFTGTVATLGGTFVWENGAHQAIFHWLGMATDLPEGPTTPDLEWPTWMVYSAIPLGSSLMCFRFLQVAWHFIKTGEVPHHDHGHVEGIEDVNPDELLAGATPAAAGARK